MRDWTVGGALIVRGDHVLLVQNRRRNGSHDWTPPGGVIDEGESVLEGLTREVQEETGLRVTEWAGPVYEVRCEAPDLGWTLRVEAHLAVAYEGELRVDDPDGIVVDARFVEVAACSTHLEGGHPWVREPLADWLAERWAHDEARPYGFHVAGDDPRTVVVTRDDVTAPRTILHVDMDAFYASVEQLRRPELRGQPVIVGAPGARGVVAAASYEARVFGVHSAMSSVRAQRLCPHAVFVPGDHDHYGEISRRVMAIFGAVTPLVEALSLDEAFLDVTGSRRLLGDGATIAASIRARVLAEEGLPCSVGVAASKFIAKLASEAAKPRVGRRGPEPGLGVKVVVPGEELAFLHPLPVQALWGVGPKTLERLQGRGITTVAQLAALDERGAQELLGSANGAHLWRLAQGLDDRAVVPDQKPKSIGHEETFARDHHRYETLRHELVRLGDSVASRLRAAGVAGRTVSIKVRFGDFRTITRAVTLPTAIDTGPDVVRAATALLERIDPAPGVRLLGVHVSQLSDHAARQLSLDDVDAPSWDDATGAVDAIRARFGADAIVPASLAGPEGIRIKRRGDQQWGPSEQGGS